MSKDNATPQEANATPEKGTIVSLEIKNSFNELGTIQKSFSAEQVQFVMQTVAPGLNDKEIWLFLLKANKLGLNPLMGEIFAYVAESNGKRQLVVIEGRNGKRNLAVKTGRIEYIKTEAIYVREIEKDGQKYTIKSEPWDGTLWGATSEIKLKDSQEPLPPVMVPLKEYNTGKNAWAGKPETMIKKVAESQALSAALPEVMRDLVGEGENFITGETKSLPTIEGGDEPASDSQLATLKTLGVDTNGKTYTKQEAVEAISIANAEKWAK